MSKRSGDTNPVGPADWARGVYTAQIQGPEATETEQTISVGIARVHANQCIVQPSCDARRIAASVSSNERSWAIRGDWAFGGASHGTNCIRVRETREVDRQLLTKLGGQDAIFHVETRLVDLRYDLTAASDHDAKPEAPEGQ